LQISIDRYNAGMEDDTERARRLRRKILWLRLIALACLLFWVFISEAARTEYPRNWRVTGWIVVALAFANLYPIQRRITRTKAELRG
jgi:hypothetical protein